MSTTIPRFDSAKATRQQLIDQLDQYTMALKVMVHRAGGHAHIHHDEAVRVFEAFPRLVWVSSEDGMELEVTLAAAPAGGPGG